MLESICKMLRGLGANGTRLDVETYEGLMELIESVYGLHARDTVQYLFVKAGKKHYICMGETEDALRICLQGRG